MRALVCGGAGFIGSHLVDRLVSGGDVVLVIDNLSHGRAENLTQAQASGACDLVKMSITDPELDAVVVDFAPEVVFHLAAQIDVRVSVTDPLLDASTNVLGTVAVLEAARRARARKVVFASSVAIYGPPARLPVTETSPVNPLSPYAVSKLSAEHYLRQYRDLHGLDNTTLALTNTYGPRQDPHGEAGVVAIFAAAMLAGRPTRVFGKGDNTRDYAYVEDVADAFVRAVGPPAVGSPAVGPPAAGARLNIATGVAVSDLELNRAVADAVGVDAGPSFAPPRLGDIPHMVVDASAARRELGWSPRVPLAEGIARTVAYFRGG